MLKLLVAQGMSYCVKRL